MTHFGNMLNILTMKAIEKKSRHWRNGGEKTKESECTSKKEGESRERRKENFDT